MARRFSIQWKTAAMILGILIVVIIFSLEFFQKSKLPPGIASGNGRTKAVEVDITTKFGGRVSLVLVNEGDKVKINQPLAQIDTKELGAQLRQAEAGVRSTRQERISAIAVIAQRNSELSLVKKDLERSKGLYENDSISLEQLQRDETSVQTAKAALAAAQAQLSSSEAGIEAAIANTELLKVQIEDSILKSPIAGRVLYRLTEPGEVLPAGGKVLTILNPVDVYMTIFLPTQHAAKLIVGAEARLLLDGIPDQALPARVSFVAPKAQFTPKEVETRAEREKLMFRIKIKLAPDFLRQHAELSKTGVPGVAYIRLQPDAQWPKFLPQVPMP